jgi:hypothetical protein
VIVVSLFTVDVFFDMYACIYGFIISKLVFFLNCGNGCFLKYFLFENILK